MSRRGRGRGQGNRGRKSGRARGSVGGGPKGGGAGSGSGSGSGSGKGKGKGKGRGHKVKSKIRSKTLKGKLKSLGFGKKTTATNQMGRAAAKARQKAGIKTPRSKFNVSNNIRRGWKALRSLKFGSPAHAATVSQNKQNKRFSKLRKQWNNLQNNIRQQSTKEARFKRRRDRMYNQHGLDYSRMKKGMTIKINPKQWLGGLERVTAKPGGFPTIRTGWLRKRIPKALSGNWINHTLRSPTKLGAADGWTRKSSSRNKSHKGYNIPVNTTQQSNMIGATPAMQRYLLDRGKPAIQGYPSRRPPRVGGGGMPWSSWGHGDPIRMGPGFPGGGPIRHPGRGQDQFGPGRPKPRPIRGGDWLANFYARNNIGGRGGNLDEGARKYWTEDAQKRGIEATMDTIRSTAMDQGTWGGPVHFGIKRRPQPNRRKRTTSEAAIRHHRRSQMKPVGRRRRGGRGQRFNQAVHHRGGGYRGLPSLSAAVAQMGGFR